MQLKGRLIQNSCFIVDMFLFCQAVLERIIIVIIIVVIIIVEVKTSLFAPEISSANRQKLSKMHL